MIVAVTFFAIFVIGIPGLISLAIYRDMQHNPGNWKL